MSVFPDNQSGEFLFLPKQGENKTVVVLGEVQRIKDENSQFSYKKQGASPFGYYDIMPVVDDDTGEETKLLINVWKFYFALKEFEDLNVGDTIVISHPSRGEYTITKK